MPDRRLSEVLGCQADDLPLVDNVAPAYAYREVHEAENEDAHSRMVMVALVVFVFAVALIRYWVWPGIQAGMEREEIKREGR